LLRDVARAISLAWLRRKVALTQHRAEFGASRHQTLQTAPT
jgi:hypothetical protein